MIGHYSLGGAENKRTILAAEGLDPDGLERRARAGERLIGSRHDAHRVLADVPPRPPGEGPPPRLVPLARGGRREATGRARCADRYRYAADGGRGDRADRRRPVASCIAGWIATLD